MEYVLLPSSNAAYAFSVEFRIGGNRHKQIEDNFLITLSLRSGSRNLPTATLLPYIFIASVQASFVTIFC